jgi:glycosyltransferase involved in cell wall biosynthesis
MTDQFNVSHLAEWVPKAVLNALTSDRGLRFARIMRRKAPIIRAALQPMLSAIHDRLRTYYVVTQPKTEPSGARPRLLIDVSTTFDISQVSGIQRTVRSLVSALKRNGMQYSFEIVPVRLRRNRMAFTLVTAQDFPEAKSDGDVLTLRKGDCVFMLDSSWHIYPKWSEVIFPVIRSLGGIVITCIYDILPVTHPQWFPSKTVRMFSPWFKLATEESDAILSISRATRLEVEQRSKLTQGQSSFFHLGADFNSGPSSQPSTHKSPIPTFLMVGTIEPRKGHATVLDAFEEIWRSGQQMKLIIVGRPGWKVRALMKRIRKIDKKNEAFIFHEGASDQLLSECYRYADVVVAASLAEGFGLPLVETLRLGKPIIASDIPAFREVAGDLPTYFEPGNPTALVTAIKATLSEKRSQPKLLPVWLTWDESAGQLMNKIDEFNAKANATRA